MEARITIENYRSFGTPHRFTLQMQPGIVGLVGPNNSGKSNVLRFFYELRGVFAAISSGPVNGTPTFHLPKEISDPADIFSNSNRDGITITIEVAQQPGRDIMHGQQYRVEVPSAIMIKIQRDTNAFSAEYRISGSEQFVSYALSQRSDVPQGLLVAQGQATNLLLDFSPIRSVAEKLADTVYIGPYRNLINVGGAQDYYDLQIGDRFIQAWTQSYSGPNKRQNNAARTLLDEIRQIFGYDMLDMPAAAGALQTYVNGKPFGINEHGAGLAQFLMVLFAVEQKRPTYILIDEPELHLHPKLQLSFLTSIAARAKDGTLFATHSLGLARSAADVIYSVTRSRNTRNSVLQDYQEIKNLNEVLGELSYSGNYNLGNSAVLLIEGKTEYKTYQEILRKFGADQAITLLSLGGSSGINKDAAEPISELFRVTSKIFAVVDSERSAMDANPLSSVKDFAKICQEMGVPVLVYERRAIENYLIHDSVREIQGVEPLGPYDAVPSGWSKSLNWKIARNMTLSDFENTDIGRFLRDVVLA